MIYSLTQFAGAAMEREILALRLAEELPRIDKFVIIEGNHTFAGAPKPWHMKKHMDLLSNPKVEPIFYRFPKVNRNRGWDNAEMQRSALARDFRDEDIIIWTDLDEIIKNEDIPRICAECETLQYARLAIHNHCFKINYFGDVDFWKRLTTPFVITGREFKRQHRSLHDIRYDWNRERKGEAAVPVIETDGHHLDYLMTPEQIVAKFDTLAAHCYRRNTALRSLQYLRSAIDNGWDVIQRRPRERIWTPRPITDIYPKSITANVRKWAPWIAPLKIPSAAPVPAQMGAISRYKELKRRL